MEYEERPKYIVWLPKPHPDLSPNARMHWRPLAKLKQSARYNSKLIFRSFMAQNKLPEKVFTKATIKAIFFYKTNHVRDHRNCEAMMKSSDDGMKDAKLLIDDDQITWKPSEIVIEKDKNPHVEYWIYSLS